MKNRLLIVALAVCSLIQMSYAQAIVAQAPLDSVVTIYAVVEGVESAAGSGIVVGAEGFVLTPLHLVKNASQISVKLRNGEIYDNAKIANKDERRNIALLRIIAGKLSPIANRTTAEPVIGSAISVISNSSGTPAWSKDATLSGMQMADGITGAGNGYRVITFEARASENLVGGLLLDDTNRPVGIITTNPNVRQGNIAVPFSSISGLFPASNTEIAAAKTGSPEVPVKVVGTTDQKINPEWTKAHKVLHTAQTIYVHSSTGFIQDEAFIAELMKNTDFAEWGWSFSNDRENADLVLEVKRLPWVIKFAFKIYSIKHGVIIASGNVHTNDLNYGSPDLVREVIKRIKLEMAMAK
jgi:Trypsin-like peptidase domain